MQYVQDLDGVTLYAGGQDIGSPYHQLAASGYPP
jgi:hypothetical protein